MNRFFGYEEPYELMITKEEYYKKRVPPFVYNLAYECLEIIFRSEIEERLFKEKRDCSIVTGIILLLCVYYEAWLSFVDVLGPARHVAYRLRYVG